jgi:hypothetical protein
LGVDFTAPVRGGFITSAAGGGRLPFVGGGLSAAISANEAYSPKSSSGTAKTMEDSNSSSIGSPKSRKTFEMAASDSRRKRLFI